MRQAAIQALGSFPPSLRKTITLDNGTENTLHERIDTELGTRSYFCKPYHRTNQEEINNIIVTINATPMKCLGFKIPIEVFANYTSVARAC
jgi:IS30 family transposase